MQLERRTEINPDLAQKLSFDESLTVVDATFAKKGAEKLASNPVGSASYARLQRQGTDVRFTNDPDEPSMGSFDPITNSIDINMAKHSSATEVASTIVHESTHQNGFFKGIPQNTKLTEYRAFRNEALFKDGRRPPLDERRAIWERVEYLYPHLDNGRHPFGGGNGNPSN
jgi:hypothetical protein